MSEYPDINKVVNFNFFCTPLKRNSEKIPNEYCGHIGYLEKDGYNTAKSSEIQRIRCAKCGKRFGNNVSIYHLNSYSEKIRKIIYELFFYKYPLTGTAKRWGIPQDKLSKFKKTVIHQIYAQNQEELESTIKQLPKGVILGDETFMGSMGNSNSQIVFINNIFEVLSTGPAIKGNLRSSILDTFNKIPEICRNKLQILLSDGEPSYKSVVQEHSKKIIHVIQYHNKAQLGQISIQKYEKVGPHLFHYIINTHWKAFQKDKHVLRFKWAIKLIKKPMGMVSGRLSKSAKKQQMKLKWRQKLEKYQNGTIKKNGTAEVFVNFSTNTISMRAGSSNWMKNIMEPVFKIFKGGVVTTGYVESKHHQIKSFGARRKQQDSQYSHELFTIGAFMAENGYLPETNFQGRPLFKYLIKKTKTERYGYVLKQNETNFIQTVLSIN